LISEFSKSDVITIKPDTLFFDLGKSTSKKLKVTPDVKIEFQSGFNLSDELSVEPEEITISGPKAQIDSITEIKTKLLDLKSVNKSINEEVSLAINKKFSKVNYSESRVKIKGTVEKFTEQTISTNFKIINSPGDYKVVTFPKKVELVFQIGLSDFIKINEKDFSVECDYNDSRLNEIDYLIPKLVKKPGLVKDVKIMPSKIQFLLEK
ncbi:MAG: YbbR-like domain-containing protein, partial [Flavobacteriaceae bacterium]|nr:YbbR-like domain-containing protein [Flavobacteriaceae bacterium]